MRTETCDIIVIGGGSAAFDAAVSARKAGAERIVMLEKAPEGEYGGNARYSGTGFRFVHGGKSEIREFVPDVDDATFATMEIPPYSAADFTSDLERMTQGKMNPDLAKTLVEESNAAIHWMRDVGIKWEPLKEHAKVDGKLYYERGIAIHVAGGGVGQLTQWRNIAEKLGIEIRFDSPVSAILGDMRRIEGVRVLGPDGAYEIKAKAVIACAGGFQASAEMRARYLVGNTDAMKVRGSKHDTGEVLRYLVDLGAKASGQWQSGHMSPIDANAPDFETPQHEDGRGNTQSRYDYPYGISVNGLGVRFFDEGEAQHSYTYAKTGRAVLGQPGGRAFQLYDQKGIKCFRYPHHKATYEEAGTIAELAKKIGLEAKVLVHTVETFNKAVVDDKPFDWRRPDGRHTKGLDIPKSNWAIRLDEPPFRAYPVVCGITFTFGGVQVDTKAQVLNTMDQPIKGLFASGDILGLFFHNYPSFTGQTRNAVFGRLAGASAVAEN
ncbi:MAG TPA: FAD-dependent tricarballylate dehydrogenase TcuA [Alphaproteobacteria bacterium]|nr:FAD-dependent tricarballylate dehydrogenase TcuA [Alphaproteobacteria bacterium]